VNVTSRKNQQAAANAAQEIEPAIIERVGVYTEYQGTLIEFLMQVERNTNPAATAIAGTKSSGAGDRLQFELTM